jgi:hypothetical protein
MIFNANKFGKKSGGNDSNNNSVSPSRKGTPVEKPRKSPKISRNNNDGMSMISGNSSGRFSRNMFGVGG